MVLKSDLCIELFDADSAFEVVSMPQTQIWLNMGEVGSERWLLFDERNVKWKCTEPYNCDPSESDLKPDAEQVRGAVGGA